MLLSFRQRIIFFICISVFGMAVAGLAGGFILTKFDYTSAAMRIAAVLQSLLQMIIPAIATAMIVTRRPATFLAIDRRIDLTTLLLSVLALVAATPLMNALITFNNGLTLPDSMKEIEDAIREMETRANESITLLQGTHTIGNLIMNILIIGILAGFGEELFFRGTFMRLLTTGRVNRHVAIWTVAIIFSAMHLQFFGFIPRTLLGAFFGYLLAWSRCLWIPIIVHATNNIIYVVNQYIYADIAEDATPLDSIGINGDYTGLIVSVIITTILFTAIYRRRVTDRQNS